MRTFFIWGKIDLTTKIMTSSPNKGDEVHYEDRVYIVMSVEYHIDAYYVIVRLELK